MLGDAKRAAAELLGAVVALYGGASIVLDKHGDGLPDWAFTLRERLALSAAFGRGDVFVEAKAAGWCGCGCRCGHFFSRVFVLVVSCLWFGLDWTEHVSHVVSKLVCMYSRHMPSWCRL